MNFFKKQLEKKMGETFKKQVMDRVSEEMSDEEYSCRMEERKNDYGNIVGVYVYFDFVDTSIVFRLLDTKTYFDYNKETVDSAAHKIIEAVSYRCHTLESGICLDRNYYGVYFLSKHLLEKFDN